MYQLVHTQNSAIPKCGSEHQLSINPKELLKVNLIGFHVLLAENGVEQRKGIVRFTATIPNPYFNAVMGNPQEDLTDQCVAEEIAHFKGRKSSFIWIVEKTDERLSRKLISSNFKSLGIIQGFVENLLNFRLDPLFPEGYKAERIFDIEKLKEFNNLICHFLNLKESEKIYRNQFFEKEFSKTSTSLSHYAVFFNNKIVTVLSTFIQNDAVMVMNGNTLPEHRGKKLLINLGKFATKEAVKLGCQWTVAYQDKTSSERKTAPSWRYQIYLHE